MNLKIETSAVTATLFALTLGAAHAQSDNYFERYAGQWEGGGSVQVEQLPKPVKVSCDIAGDVESETAFKLAGECGAMFVLSNDIGAELTLDPETGEYTGVYTGSASGPAQLVGTKEGDTLDLEVTWNKVIYDDDKARMTIENTDGESFILQVTETIEGEDVIVSDLTFEKQATN